MKNLLFLPVFLLASCQKPATSTKCISAVLLSKKYTLDTVLVRTDTLWQDPLVCGKDAESILSAKPIWFAVCQTGGLENWVYVIRKNF